MRTGRRAKSRPKRGGIRASRLRDKKRAPGNHNSEKCLPQRLTARKDETSRQQGGEELRQNGAQQRALKRCNNRPDRLKRISAHRHQHPSSNYTLFATPLIMPLLAAKRGPKVEPGTTSVRNPPRPRVKPELVDRKPSVKAEDVKPTRNALAGPGPSSAAAATDRRAPTAAEIRAQLGPYNPPPSPPPMPRNRSRSATPGKRGRALVLGWGTYLLIKLSMTPFSRTEKAQEDKEKKEAGQEAGTFRVQRYACRPSPSGVRRHCGLPCD